MRHDLKPRPPGIDPALFADVKRFCERWIGDDRFRAEAARDAAAACRAAGLALDPRPLAFLWNPAAPPVDDAPETAAFAAIAARQRAFAAFCADDAVPDPRLAAWRARQRARCAFELGAVAGMANPHVPFAVELTEGCSVGCWFCGLSAGKLVRQTAADAAAIEEWRTVLDALGAAFGAYASRGILFWATDPLDHPAYEAFAECFAEAFGVFPATTTALALADPGRTRALARRAAGGPGLRFSVTTRRALDGIHATFSAIELIDVDLVLANRESLHGLAAAGRLRGTAGGRGDRERGKRDAAVGGARAEHEAVHETIACVSGFLLDLPARRLRLVAPVRASERWPDGYAVLHEARFRDAGELAAAIGEAIGRHMPEAPPPDGPLSVQAGMAIEAAPDGLSVAANGHSMRFARRGGPGALPLLAGQFRSPTPLADAVAAVRLQSADAVADRLHADAATLWRHGVLVEPVFVAAPGAAP